MMPEYERPMCNPLMVLREEFDDWAILFDPDSGNAFGLNPTGVAVWKLFDGKHTYDDIVRELQANLENVPNEAKDHLKEFVRDLAERGFVGFEVQKAP